MVINGVHGGYILRIVFGTSLLAILLLAGIAGAVPIEEWNKTYGGGGVYQGANSVQQTSDGGYIIAGTISFYYYSNAFLIKTDANGNELWRNVFNRSTLEGASSVQQTSDGGYVLVGTTTTNSYDLNTTDASLVKTDANGTELWNKTLRGSGYDIANSGQQTSDDGYIIAGKTMSYGAGDVDAWLIKTDANGTELWNKTFGGTNYSDANSVQQTSDGGYILTGKTVSNDAISNTLLIKTDANGNQLWSKTFGGTNYSDANSVQQTSDGGYILAGITAVSDNSSALLIKTDANGNQLWSKTFGDSSIELANSVQQTSDSGYIIAGKTESFGVENGDAWLIKTDTNGTELWNKTFGGSEYDTANSVQQTSDGGYILAGVHTERTYWGNIFQAWLIKISSDAEITPTPTFNISGFKINSTDNSGIQGWNITLSNSTMQTSTTTGADGSYIFTNLVNGTYNVTEGTQTGWTSVSPMSQQVTISGADVPNINFTNQPLTTPTPTPTPTPTSSICIVSLHPVFLNYKGSSPTSTYMSLPYGIQATLYNPATTTQSVSFTVNEEGYKPEYSDKQSPPLNAYTTIESGSMKTIPVGVVSHYWKWLDPKDSIGTADTFLKVLKEGYGDAMYVNKLADIVKESTTYDGVYKLDTLIFFYKTLYTLNLALPENTYTYTASSEIPVCEDGSRSTSVTVDVPDKKKLMLVGAIAADYTSGAFTTIGIESLSYYGIGVLPIAAEFIYKFEYSDLLWNAAKDPDSNYTEIVQSSPALIPNALLNENLTDNDKRALIHLSNALGFTDAALKSIQKADGAAIAGNDTWQIIQLRNARNYLQQNQFELNAFFSYANDSIKAAQKLYNSTPNADTVVANYLRSNGLPPIEVNSLKELGYTSQEINNSSEILLDMLPSFKGENLTSYISIGSFPPINSLLVNVKDELEIVSNTTNISNPIDIVLPTSKITLNGSLGTNNWYISPVQVTISATDNPNGTGVKTIEYSLDKGQTWLAYSKPFTISNDGIYIILSRATDNEGNIEFPPQKQEIQIDKTPPIITGNVTTSPNANGWYDTNVTVHFNASDNISGIATITHDIVISTEGANQSVTGTATDMAGNSASFTVSGINFDKTPPQITINMPANGSSYILKQIIVANWSVNDSISGVTSAIGTTPSGAAIDTTSIGTKTFSVNATDNAGNQANKTATYNVIYNYNGILPPIKPYGNSTFKLGSTIPVKFQLWDASRNNISTATAHIYLTNITNGATGKEINGASSGNANTGNLFRYDSVSNQYIFNLATKQLSAGTWRIRISLDDGTSKYATIGLVV